MSIPNADHAFDAVLTMLRKATGKQWGDDIAPGADTTVLDDPYGIVELVPGGGVIEGDIGQPSSMMAIVVQLTSVARTRKGATALAARAHQAMLSMGPAGYSDPIVPAPPTLVLSRRHDSSGGVDREGPLFNAAERYVLVLSSV